MTRIRYAHIRSDFPDSVGEGDNYSPFKSRLRDTIEKLGYELEKLEVVEAVIEIDCTDSQLRAIRKGDCPQYSEVASPRVRLTFTHPKLGLLQYPCHTYRSYQANIRAIVLTLEALRAIDRYGACRDGQQYEGFKELPAGDEQERYFVNAYEAAEFIAELAGKSPATAEAIVEDPEYLAYCYKAAAKKAHPDSGGSDAKFKSLQQAKELIECDNVVEVNFSAA